MWFDKSSFSEVLKASYYLRWHDAKMCEILSLSYKISLGLTNLRCAWPRLCIVRVTLHPIKQHVSKWLTSGFRMWRQTWITTLIDNIITLCRQERYKLQGLHNRSRNSNVQNSLLLQLPNRLPITVYHPAKITTNTSKNPLVQNGCATNVHIIAPPQSI